MSDYKIQSVLFSTKKWNPQTASEWLKENNYQVKKIDQQTPNFLRFRQTSPKPLENAGYHFVNKKLGNSGVELVIAYPPEKQSKGGKISIGNLKHFIDNSYSKKPKENIEGYVIDKAISNDIAKTYYNPETGHAVITHRGTSGAKDWANNLAYLTGLYKYTDRYKRGKKAQEATNKKYGKENVSTVGHSQGAVLARHLGEGTKEIINLNPAYVAEKPKKNEYNIKSSSDVVSKLKPIHKKDIEIQATTSNPLTEHSTEILNRLDVNQEVGRGRIPVKSMRRGGANIVIPSALKAFQMKIIIDEYNKKADTKIKGYKTANKTKLMEILKENKINPFNYAYPSKNPNAKPYVRAVTDARKKYGVKAYTEPEQEAYLLNLSNDPRYANPLQALKQYTNKEGKKEYVGLEPHQRKFIKQFIYSNLRGVIAFHGVGSGKTLNAVVASYYYLKMYPKNKVIVISPSALLYNFTNGMIQYGLDIADNRYHFYTYDKYIRKPEIGKNALIIVDEAHNFRTEMHMSEVRDDNNEVVDRVPTTNKRFAGLKKFGSDHAHKILLLTGTAFINGLYDIENLLSMVDQRDPIDRKAYGNMISDALNVPDYFNYRISFYQRPSVSEFFPQRIEKLIPCYMSKEEEERYDELKQEGRDDIERESAQPNAFLGAERYASNAIGGIGNKKVKWILDEIMKQKHQKFIVYSGLYDAGVKILFAGLDKLGVGYKAITGRQSTGQKEESKKWYNGYNFGNPDFFDLSVVDPSQQKYINDKIRVLVITKAGAEGVDTINTQNIVLMDAQWNDALSEQIIARAIRYKSHHGLPKEQRYVNVYRTVYLRESNKEIFEQMAKPDFNDWMGFKSELDEKTKLKMKLMKMNDERYLPTVAFLKEMKGEEYSNGKPTGRKYPFIAEKAEYKKRRGAIGKKWETVKIRDGWDEYKALDSIKDKDTREAKRKEWRIERYADWYEAFGKPENERQRGAISPIGNLTSDLRMLINARAKTANIDKFCEEFGNNISMFESYEKEFIPIVKERIEKLQKKKKNIDVDAEECKIYAELFKNANIKILKTSYEPVQAVKEGRATQAVNQAYFTSQILADALLDYSSIKSKPVTEHFKVLEPTAGDGALVRPILKLGKDANIDMIEINRESRNKLIELAKQSPSLNVLDQTNFLKCVLPAQYEYVFTNPPFHIKKGENALLKSDVWDFHFVKRAFAMLKVKGELVAITSKHWMFGKDAIDFRKWLGIADGEIVREKGKGSNDRSLKFEFVVREQEKFGEDNKELGTKAVKIDVCILKLVKTSTLDDNDILGYNFYNNNAEEIGTEILNNDMPVIAETKPTPKNLIVEPQPEVPDLDYTTEPKTESKIKIEDFKNVDFLREGIDLYYRNKNQHLTNLSKFNLERLKEIIKKREIKLDELSKFYNKAIANAIDMYKNSDNEKMKKKIEKWKELIIKNVEEPKTESKIQKILDTVSKQKKPDDTLEFDMTSLLKNANKSNVEDLINNQINSQKKIIRQRKFT